MSADKADSRQMDHCLLMLRSTNGERTRNFSGGFLFLLYFDFLFHSCLLVMR